MSMEIDSMYGFTSDWSFNEGDGCWEHGGRINIDLVEIDGIVKESGLPESHLETVTWLIMWAMKRAITCRSADHPAAIMERIIG